MSKNKKNAIVFYARDFLADEFSRIGKCLDNLECIYIVVSKQEQTKIERIDKYSVVYNLNNTDDLSVTYKGNLDADMHNKDRFLRYYSNKRIQNIVSFVDIISKDIIDKYNVKFYLDEPVSGYPNFIFNNKFKSSGAQCLHFQTAWLPNYMFFTSDAAQKELIPLNIGHCGSYLVKNHIKKRQKGMGLPNYVIGYGSVIKRFKDILSMFLKGLYRVFYRKLSYYVDRDASAHFFHVRSLMSIAKGGYINNKRLNLLNEKYVVFPLHYEPEAVLNYYSEFTRQEEIAESIIDTLPLGYKLILKEHPSQPGALNLSKWKKITNCKRILKVRGDTDINYFLSKKSAVVVSIGSTMALEAAIAGCPSGVFGNVHFKSMPGITFLASPSDWRVLINQKPHDQSEIIKYYGEFIDKYCFKGNIMKNQTKLPNFQKLLDLIVKK